MASIQHSLKLSQRSQVFATVNFDLHRIGFFSQKNTYSRWKSERKVQLKFQFVKTFHC